MGNKYNSLTDTLRGICVPTYTLTLAGGAANTAVTFANSATAVTPFTPLGLTSYLSSGNPTRYFNNLDRTARLVRAALFCNFADGFLWADTDGPPNVLFQLSKDGNLLTNSSAVNVHFPALNTWIEVDRPLTYNAGDGLATYISCVAARPTTYSPEITLKTNSIGTEWNGIVASFYVMAEIEHTFPLSTGL